jgi:hypothetical protein
MLYIARLQAAGSRFLILADEKDFSLLQKVYIGSGPIQSSIY